MPEIRIEDLIIPKFDDLLIDVLDHKHTHYTLLGGRGSTKSSFVGVAIPLLITQHKNIHAIVYRKVAGTLRDSVYAQIMAGITLLGINDQFKCTVSPMEITYKPTGQRIYFRGLDQPEKIKSIKPPFGYIAISWYEELDQFHGREEIRNTQQSTMRGGEVFWNFESFNPPITASNWANKDVLKERKDRLVVHSTYKDVPVSWLGEQFIEEAVQLKMQNERAYKHEYLGEAVGTGGMVFENLVKRTITDAEIASFDRVYNGVDWGWYPDPWAFTRSYYNANKNRLWIFYEDGGCKLSNSKSAERVKNVLTAEDLVTCDSAEPKSTDAYRAADIWAQNARKGPGSIQQSMKWLSSLNAIYIDHIRCPKAYAEFSEYEYKRDKNGDLMYDYPDANNHYIDATRYATESIWRNPLRG